MKIVNKRLTRHKLANPYGKPQLKERRPDEKEIKDLDNGYVQVIFEDE